MEYLPTNLPQYVKQTSRTALANSVIQNGHVLLFSEDGSSLTAKLPDGSFVTVGGSGGSTDFYKCASVSGAVPEIKSPEDAAGNTGTGYTISVSSIFNENYDGWKAFNGDTVDGDHGWFSAPDNSYGPQWLQILFSTAQVINYYSFNVAYDSQSQHYSAWKLQASNDGTTWTDLDDVTGQDLYSDNSAYSSYLNNSTAYSYYRIYFAGTGGYSYIGLQNVKLGYLSSVLSWTGYKAIFDSVTNTYRFSSTITSGLTWTVITPTVGKVYADGALIEAKLWTGIPENGLIRYAPMNATASEDEMANALTVGGSPTFAADSGIGCAEMTDSYIGYQSPITGLTAYSLSIWMKRLQSGDALMTFSGGSYGYGGNELWIALTADGTVTITNGGAEDYLIIETTNTFSGWVNIVLVWTGSVFRLYVNGEQQGNDTSTEYVSEYSYLYPYINSLQRATSVKGAGKYAAFRLYDRVLNATEIAALSAEFTPGA